MHTYNTNTIAMTDSFRNAVNTKVTEPALFQDLHVYKRQEDNDDDNSSTEEFFQDLQQLTTIKAVVSSSTRNIDNAVKSASSSLSIYDGIAAAGVIITDSETGNDQSVSFYATTSFLPKSIVNVITSGQSSAMGSHSSVLNTLTDEASSASSAGAARAASKPQMYFNSSGNAKLTLLLYGLLATALMSIGL